MERPPGAPPALIGAATGPAPDLPASTPPGAIHVSEAFAATLHSRADLQPGATAAVGELVRHGRAVELYALTPPTA